MKMKNTALIGGNGQTHPEFTVGTNIAELKFRDQVVIPFDNGDGKIWFTSEELARLLGYADKDKVLNLYYRHQDEFTSSMTTVAKVRVDGINNSLRYVDTRLFSPRGAHLVGMLSRTKIAKELRIWLLDLADKETSIPQVGSVQHTIQQLQNIVTATRRASDEDSSDAGRRLRKRRDDLPELVRAQGLVDAMRQIPFDLIGGGKAEVLP
ncbi:BRO-N domain-containing protein [Serratia fonticola]